MRRAAQGPRGLSSPPASRGRRGETAQPEGSGLAARTRPPAPHVFGGRPLHRHGHQVLSPQQHQPQDALLLPLRLLRVLGPGGGGGGVRRRAAPPPGSPSPAPGPAPPHLILRNSSQSHRMRFMCLSKALKVPMKTRPSCRMQRMR